MKKIILPIGIISLVGLMFSGVGWYFVRGIKIYSIDSSFGLVLSGSWKICLVITIIACALFAVILAKFMVNKKARKEIKQLEVDGKKRNKDGKIEPTLATVIRPTAEETSLTNSSITEIDFDKTEVVENKVDAISNKKEISIASDITEIISFGDETTQVLEKPNQEIAEKEKVNTPNIINKTNCAKCNAILIKGNKFCTSCGAKVE